MPVHIAPGLTTTFLDSLRESSAWAVESAYVRRGGFTVQPNPALAMKISANTVFAAFQTDVEYVEPGIPVGLALYADVSSGKVLLAHVLTSGPEPEPALLFGSSALGLPPPQAGQAGVAARESYAHWRRRGWSQFWLRELEEGLHAASRFWLVEYWEALRRLFGLSTPGA